MAGRYMYLIEAGTHLVAAVRQAAEAAFAEHTAQTTTAHGGIVTSDDPRLSGATETAKGVVEFATAAEIQAGTAGTLAPSAARLKAELDRRATSEDWNAPFLTNAWGLVGPTNNEPGYRKNPFGEVFVKGIVGGGAPNTVVFVLPQGYRPAHPLRFAVDSFNGTSLVHGSVEVRGDGAVQHVTGGTAQVHVNLPSFRAA